MEGRDFFRLTGRLGLIQLLLLFILRTAHAGSATWNLNPTSGDWNTAANWTPATVPNGPADTATFDISNTTDVSLSTKTTVEGIVFNPGASAFTIATSPALSLTITGSGIVNNSGVTQNFATAVNESNTTEEWKISLRQGHRRVLRESCHNAVKTPLLVSSNDVTGSAR